jgi:hypothetical protein
VKRSLLLAVLLVACKGKETATSDPAPPAVSAKASASAKPKLTGKPVIGTDVKATACNLGSAVPEGENSVAASRHLHLAPGNLLYFFVDFKGPTRLDPVADGCGYRFGENLVEEKGSSFGLEPDGSLKQYPHTDESDVAKCRTRAFSEMRYGRGALVGGKFYDESDGALYVMDLASDKCSKQEAKLPEIEKETGRPFLGTAEGQLLVAFGRQDWHYDREVFRFDEKGKFVRKYGSADPKKSIGGSIDGCGDGLCVLSGGVYFAIHDREGEKVKSYNLYDLVKLKRMDLANLVDVPGKGVYALVGYHDEKNKGRAELLRLDGVRAPDQ